MFFPQKSKRKGLGNINKVAYIFKRQFKFKSQWFQVTSGTQWLVIKVIEVGNLRGCYYIALGIWRGVSARRGTVRSWGADKTMEDTFLEIVNVAVNC